MKKAYKSKTKFLITALLVLAMAMVFTACGDDEKEAGGDVKADTENSIIYASNDYTRINPAIDEHGEINLLIFDGLMGHDKDNNVVPALAEKYDLDNDTTGIMEDEILLDEYGNPILEPMEGEVLEPLDEEARKKEEKNEKVKEQPVTFDDL